MNPIMTSVKTYWHIITGTFGSLCNFNLHEFPINITYRQDYPVSTVTRLRTGHFSKQFSSWQRQETSFFSKVSRQVPGATQLPSQWIPGSLSPDHKASHSLPPSIEVKSAWSSISTPPMCAWHATRLIYHTQHILNIHCNSHICLNKC